MSALTPAEILYQQQHIGDDLRADIAVCNGMCLGIAVVAVILRFVCRRIARVPLGMDDWTVVIALVHSLTGLGCADIWSQHTDRQEQMLYVVYVLSASFLVHYGMGRHIILLKDPRRFVIVRSCLQNTSIGIGRLLTLFFTRKTKVYHLRSSSLQRDSPLLQAIDPILLPTYIPTNVVQTGSRWHRRLCHRPRNRLYLHDHLPMCSY